MPCLKTQTMQHGFAAVTGETQRNHAACKTDCMSKATSNGKVDFVALKQVTEISKSCFVLCTKMCDLMVAKHLDFAFDSFW